VSTAADRAGGFGLGLHVLSYGEPWSEVARVGRLADDLGYDILLAADHLYASGGDPFEPFYEGWLTLAGWAATTRRAQLGLLVGAAPLRPPALVAKLVATLDHQSGGRAVLGLGSGWHEGEFDDHGIRLGPPRERLERLDEALGIVGRLLAGEAVDHDSTHYRMRGVRTSPLPLRQPVPAIVGAEGERIGLRIVARRADLWHWWAPMGSTEAFRAKLDVLGRHCQEIGRDQRAISAWPGAKVVIRDDPAEAERVFTAAAVAHTWEGEVLGYVRASTWLGRPAEIVEALARYREAGAAGFIAQAVGPYDDETITRLATEVRDALA
jgi:alkanesulfonate monooxygenase SsuD/methylene tetrahydromethanopterin reductase-like flavin-dependent oxidoreductase (luciferase family)